MNREILLKGGYADGKRIILRGEIPITYSIPIPGAATWQTLPQFKGNERYAYSGITIDDVEVWITEDYSSPESDSAP